MCKTYMWHIMITKYQSDGLCLRHVCLQQHVCMPMHTDQGAHTCEYVTHQRWQHLGCSACACVCNCLHQHLTCTATHCNTLQHTATHCNTLQHTATHCNTLRHTATHCNAMRLQAEIHMWDIFPQMSTDTYISWKCTFRTHTHQRLAYIYIMTCIQQYTFHAWKNTFIHIHIHTHIHTHTCAWHRDVCTVILTPWNLKLWHTRDMTHGH